jgi:hypothetical protein
VTGVAFGTFSDSVGGGKYVSIIVRVELGNTATARHTYAAERRAAMVAEAYTAAIVDGDHGKAGYEV